jgi:hypothetical protein
MKTTIDRAFANQQDSTFGRLANLIATHHAKTTEAFYDVGNVLIEAKDALNHGDFGGFIKDHRVGLTVRMAQLMMQIAREDPGRELARYGIAKASLLLRVCPEARKQLCDSHDVLQLSVRRLRELVAEALGRRRTNSPKGSAGKGHPDAEYRRGYDDGLHHSLGAHKELLWAAGVLHLNVPDLSVVGIESASRPWRISFTLIRVARKTKSSFEIFTLHANCSSLGFETVAPQPNPRSRRFRAAPRGRKQSSSLIPR